MDARSLAIEGAVVFTLQRHADPRGTFLEWVRQDALEQAMGHRLAVLQANHSTSARGVIRGVHWTDVPPGQAKYVYCPIGAVLDVVVDIRVGSPTFGRHEAVVLDADQPRAVYLAEGLGHAFAALTDGAAITYLCSSTYDPARDRTLDPLDPELALPWPAETTPLLSDRDRSAPSLSAARAARILPWYDECQTLYASLRTIGQ